MIRAQSEEEAKRKDAVAKGLIFLTLEKSIAVEVLGGRKLAEFTTKEHLETEKRVMEAHEG